VLLALRLALLQMLLQALLHWQLRAAAAVSHGH